ncbi:MAG TPA: SH3 domain-containing protein [Asticcacaulis sp.]|nr:SH3 domain-containing protein [Asticcacaulis sp.]
MAASFKYFGRRSDKAEAPAFSTARKQRSSAFTRLLALTALAFALLPVRPAHAGDDLDFDTPSKSPVPRWAMLRRAEVYARNGPSKDNPVVWTYKVQSLPVQIISETRDWRLVCDPTGTVAWVSKTMLQAQKTVLSGSPDRKIEMHTGAKADSPVRAYLRPHALAQLGKCKKGWCKISADGQTGWAPADALWGTQTAPVCQRPNLFARN